MAASGPCCLNPHANPQSAPLLLQEAVRLWYTAMQGSAGSDSGIDMEQIITGASGATRAAASRLPDSIRAVLQGELRQLTRLRQMQQVQNTYECSLTSSHAYLPVPDCIL